MQEVTHHLWYLQVRAPLTSSVTAPASLISSIITTRGSSPPLSLSIWFARSERYNCNSCQRKKGITFLLRSSQSRITPWMAPDRRSANSFVQKGLPFVTGDACWRWQPRRDPGHKALGQLPPSQFCYARVGNGPGGEPGRSFLFRWARTEPGACASAASWCSAASLALESSSRTPASRRISLWCLEGEEAFDC